MPKRIDMTIEDRVKEIISSNLCVDEEEVTPQATLTDDLGGDSLDVIEVTMELETEFHISISDEDVEKIKTVQDVVDMVAKRAVTR